MSEPDDGLGGMGWGRGEIVRAVVRLTNALTGFQDTVSGRLDAFERDHPDRAEFEALRAEWQRWQDARQGTWRFWVEQLSPIAVGVFVAWLTMRLAR